MSGLTGPATEPGTAPQAWSATEVPKAAGLRLTAPPHPSSPRRTIGIVGCGRGGGPGSVAPVTLDHCLNMRLFGGQLMRVQGRSMRPTLEPGNLVWVAPSRSPQRGDIVAARPAACGGRAIIKRITNVSHDGDYFLSGDAPDDSTDSRSFGPVAFGELIGVVTRIKF